MLDSKELGRSSMKQFAKASATTYPLFTLVNKRWPGRRQTCAHTTGTTAARYIPMFSRRSLPTEPCPQLSTRVGKWLRETLHHVLDHTLPELCAACRAVESSTLLCAQCSLHQDPERKPIHVQLPDATIPAYAPFTYTLAVRSAVHRLKFEAHPELARRAAAAMYGALPPELTTPLWWIPVPLEHARLVERGFNQSALLANELALLTLGRSFPNLLMRSAGSTKQSQLSRAERLTNLTAAFDLNGTQRPLPVGSKVALVDDVFTTGATATACCKVLRDCGYDVLAVVTLVQVTHG